MTESARRRRIISGWLLVPVALAVSTLLVLWLRPAIGRAVFGERPGPVLAAIRGETAITLAPEGLILEHEDEKAASGTVAVSRYYAYPSGPDPGGVTDFYGDALPSLGWAPMATQVGGRQAYTKSVAGKDVRYVVRADREGVLVQVWTPYDVGLIGG